MKNLFLIIPLLLLFSCGQKNDSQNQTSEAAKLRKSYQSMNFSELLAKYNKTSKQLSNDAPGCTSGSFSCLDIHQRYLSSLENFQILIEEICSKTVSIEDYNLFSQSLFDIKSALSSASRGIIKINTAIGANRTNYIAEAKSLVTILRESTLCNGLICTAPSKIDLNNIDLVNKVSKTINTLIDTCHNVDFSQDIIDHILKPLGVSSCYPLGKNLYSQLFDKDKEIEMEVREVKAKARAALTTKGFKIDQKNFDINYHEAIFSGHDDSWLTNNMHSNLTLIDHLENKFLPYFDMLETSQSEVIDDIRIGNSHLNPYIYSHSLYSTLGLTLKEQLEFHEMFMSENEIQLTNEVTLRFNLEQYSYWQDDLNEMKDLHSKIINKDQQSLDTLKILRELYPEVETIVIKKSYHDSVDNDFSEKLVITSDDISIKEVMDRHIQLKIKSFEVSQKLLDKFASNEDAKDLNRGSLAKIKFEKEIGKSAQALKVLQDIEDNLDIIDRFTVKAMDKQNVNNSFDLDFYFTDSYSNEKNTLEVDRYSYYLNVDFTIYNNDISVIDLMKDYLQRNYY